jgi:uncharacterized Zn finger protein (UPF0148 family)
MSARPLISPRAVRLIRYCPECGRVGEPKRGTYCCPKHQSADYVSERIALQARAGRLVPTLTSEVKT